MPWKIKRVPGTTNNVNQAIINFLLSKGHSASRINVQGQWDKDMNQGRGGWRPSGSRKGYFDISACIFGRGVVIDTKVSRGDRLNRDQHAFMLEWRKAGGLAEEFKTYPDFLHWYEMTFVFYNSPT